MGINEIIQEAKKSSLKFDISITANSRRQAESVIKDAAEVLEREWKEASHGNKDGSSLHWFSINDEFEDRITLSVMYKMTEKEGTGNPNLSVPFEAFNNSKPKITISKEIGKDLANFNVVPIDWTPAELNIMSPLESIEIGNGFIPEETGGEKVKKPIEHRFELMVCSEDGYSVGEFDREMTFPTIEAAKEAAAQLFEDFNDISFILIREVVIAPEIDRTIDREFLFRDFDEKKKGFLERASDLTVSDFEKALQNTSAAFFKGPFEMSKDAECEDAPEEEPESIVDMSMVDFMEMIKYIEATAAGEPTAVELRIAEMAKKISVKELVEIGEKFESLGMSEPDADCEAPEAAEESEVDRIRKNAKICDMEVEILNMPKKKVKKDDVFKLIHRAYKIGKGEL